MLRTKQEIRDKTTTILINSLASRTRQDGERLHNSQPCSVKYLAHRSEIGQYGFSYKH